MDVKQKLLHSTPSVCKIDDILDMTIISNMQLNLTFSLMLQKNTNLDIVNTFS